MGMSRIILTLLLLLQACGPRAEVTPWELSPELGQLKATYLELLPDVQDEWGFVETDRCDSLLFTSLLGVANVEVEVTEAEGDPGQWFRRPIHYAECHETGESRSTISRDMLLGVMFYSLVHQRLDIVNRLWDYGVEHSWVMGNNLHSVMTLTDISLLAEIRWKLGGPDEAVRYVPRVYASCEGYVCHLQVIRIILEAELEGGVLRSGLRSHLMEMDSTNVLFAAAQAKYVTGDFAAVERLILERYPKNRLPTSADWCESWPAQRDSSDPGLQPCPAEMRTHSGGELLFALWILSHPERGDR